MKTEYSHLASIQVVIKFSRDVIEQNTWGKTGVSLKNKEPNLIPLQIVVGELHGLPFQCYETERIHPKDVTVILIIWDF